MLDLPITNIGNIQRELYLFYRIGKDLKVMKDPTFFPYFFQLDEKGLFKTIDGKKAKKIICSRPSDLSKRRDEESYEADLIYTKRYAIDKIGTFLKCELKYSFIDIEVLCPELPQASNPIYPISCISCSNSYTGEIKTFFINDYLDPRIAVKNYEEQEKQLLDDFVKWLRDNQFDFIAAWNMINFDYAYLCGRYKFVMGTDLPNILSPIAQSRPLGEILFIPQGIGIVDYLEWYKKVYKGEQSYALDNIAQTHLNETGYEKVDFSRLSAKIKEKNINDVRRMMELEKKFKLIDYYDELRRMGKCNWEDLSWNSKILDNMLLQEAKQKGIILPTRKYAAEYTDDVTFEGAFRRCDIEDDKGNVLEKNTGLHKDIFKLDLSGAYPSAIVNFCLDVQNIKENEGTNVNGTKFVQNQNALLPTMARKLLHKKDELKKQLKLLDPESKEAKDLQSKYDAIKSVVNSLFGICGLKIFRLFNIKVASSITFLIRDLLHYVEDKLKEQGMKVIYIDTDSCAKDTPITLKTNKGIEILPIEDLFISPKTNTMSKYDISFKNYKIWTDKGWTKIKYIYRHKTKKEMYRILTRKGFIEISKDHSLVINNKSICPNKLKIGDKIELYPIKLKEECKVDNDLAWLIGFWVAEGSCGKYKKLNKISWHLDNQKIELLLKAKNILLKYGIPTKIIDCRKSSSTYRLLGDGNTKILYELFNFWCLTKTGAKKIPSFILNANKEGKESFLTGYWKGDGYICPKDKIETITSIDKSLIQGTIAILDSLNKDYSLIIRPDKKNVIALRIIRNKNDKRIRFANEIIKIEKYESNENIYDIETENHHFCGGLGNVNLHNSVFVKANDNPKDLCNQLIKQWAKERYNKDIIDISFDLEGKYDKIFIVSLCHYKGYLNTSHGVKEEVKGIEARRADSSKFMKEFQTNLLEKVMNEESRESIEKWIESEKERIKTLPLTDIGFPCKITKDASLYRSVPVFVRGLTYTQEILPSFKKVPGDSFYYINVESFGETTRKSSRMKKNKETGTKELQDSETAIKKDILVFDEDNYSHIKNVDWKKVIDKKVDKIFEALGWNIDKPIKEKKIKKGKK